MRKLLRRLVAALAFSLAALALLGAAAAQGGRWSDRLDVAGHFAPLWLWMALLAALLMLATPRTPARSATRWMAAVAAPLAVLQIAPELSRSVQPAPAGTKADLTLVQFNIWGGRNRELGRSLDWVFAQQPDVVVIEEALPRVREALARRPGYHLSCNPRSRCQTIILSRAEPLSAGVPKVEAGAALSTSAATLPGPGGPFTVVGVHYTWPIPAGTQQQQGKRVAAILDHFPKQRLILAGDFNSAPWSFTRRREDAAFGIERRTRALASWPTVATRRRLPLPFPILPIDHVYAGPGWRTVSVERGPRLGSDHYPVVVKLALSEAAPGAR
ncbi:MAG: endonuclease/exonuclease/phosphatase family protein [Phenylobacterium sp.]